MRAPPPTALRIDPSPAWRGVRACLAGLAVASLFMWAAAALWEPGDAWPWLFGIWAGLGTAVWIAIHLRDPKGHLGWTGSGWEWRPQEGQPHDIVRVDVMIDLHLGLLLRLEPRGAAAFWLAGRASADPRAWRAFRAAVYSRASRSPGPAETEPPRP